MQAKPLLIAKMLGGSRAYGLNTPTSDTDLRGVFLNQRLSDMLGMTEQDHVEDPNDEDTKYKELRRWLNLLKDSNTEAVEMLFSDEKNFLEEMDPLFAEMRKNRTDFVDSARMLVTLRGYSKGERARANGMTTGRLGGKRKDAIESHGYSAKNFVQLLRLNWAGAVFFRKGYFPVNVREEDSGFADFLVEVKTQPEKFEAQALNTLADTLESDLLIAYEYKNFNFVFNKDKAEEYALRFYYPYLKKAYLSGWTGFRDIGELKGMS